MKQAKSDSLKHTLASSIRVSNEWTSVSWFPWILVVGGTASATVYATGSFLALALIVTQCGIIKTLQSISLSIAQAVGINLNFSHSIVMLQTKYT